MDWPQLSSKMAPVDNKENNAELLTAQTETQLNNTEDNIRLKPVQPLLSESLPDSTVCPNENSNISDSKDDSSMVVSLADIGGAISVGDEIMCSVDQFEMKTDDLNLLTEQIPSVIEHVSKNELEENVPNEDLEKDLTGPVEENKELKSICEIITPNPTLASLVLSGDSVDEKLSSLLQNESSADGLLLSDVNESLRSGQSDPSEDLLLTDINVCLSKISNSAESTSEIQSDAPNSNSSSIVKSDKMCVNVGDCSQKEYVLTKNYDGKGVIVGAEKVNKESFGGDEKEGEKDIDILSSGNNDNEVVTCEGATSATSVNDVHISDTKFELPCSLKNSESSDGRIMSPAISDCESDLSVKSSFELKPVIEFDNSDKCKNLDCSGNLISNTKTDEIISSESVSLEDNILNPIKSNTIRSEEIVISSASAILRPDHKIGSDNPLHCYNNSDIAFEEKNSIGNSECSVVNEDLEKKLVAAVEITDHKSSANIALNSLSENVETSDVAVNSSCKRVELLASNEKLPIKFSSEEEKILKDSDDCLRNNIVKGDVLIDFKHLENTSEKSENCSIVLVNQEINLIKGAENVGFDCSLDALVSSEKDKEKRDEDIISVNSVDLNESVEIMSEDHYVSANMVENFNIDKRVEILSEELRSAVIDKCVDSEEDCVILECSKQNDEKSKDGCNSALSSFDNAVSLSSSTSADNETPKSCLHAETLSDVTEESTSVSVNHEKSDNFTTNQNAITSTDVSPVFSKEETPLTVTANIENNNNSCVESKNIPSPSSLAENDVALIENRKTSLPVPVTNSRENLNSISSIPEKGPSLPLPVNLESSNVSCVQNEKTIISISEKPNDILPSENKNNPSVSAFSSENVNTSFTENKNSSPSLLHNENSKLVSDAVKFFFQRGSSHLDKFLAPNNSPSSLQNIAAKVSVRKTSTDSEPSVSNQNIASISDVEQRPRSCEPAESASIPIAFFPESIIDSSGRKLPPLLPKIPLAFLISDMRGLTPGNISSSEQKSGGVSISGAGSSAMTSMSSNSTVTSVASVGVNTNFGPDSVAMPPQLQPLPQLPQKPKKYNRGKRVQHKPNQNQLPLTLFNTLNAITPTGSGFIATNFDNGQLCDIKSVEQLMVSANNDGRPPTKRQRSKGQLRNKNVRQRSRVSTATSIDDCLTFTNGTIFGGGGGVCGRRLQNVVNKLHQAIDPNMAAAAGISRDSILHNLLATEEQLKESDQAGPGPVQPSVQCLKVVESVPSSQSNIITTFRIPSALTIIPQTVVDSQSKSTEVSKPKIPEPKSGPVQDNVVDRLKKLGTIIEVEREPPQCILPSSLPPPPPLTPIAMTRTMHQNVGHNSFTSASGPDVTAQCLKMLESLAQTGNVVANTTKKKPTQRKRQNYLSNKQSLISASLLNKQNPSAMVLPIRPIDSQRSSIPKEPILKADAVGNTEMLPQNISETSSVDQVSLHETSSSQTSSVSTPLVSTIECVTPLSSLSSSASSSSSTSSPSSSSSSSYSSSSKTDDKVVPSGVTSEPVKTVSEDDIITPKPPQQIEPKFVFQIDSSQVLNLPGGQRMLKCDICDGVYHKTMSLKRHYLRTHIFRKYLSESDQIMCGMIQLDAGKPMPPKKITKVFIGDLSNWVNSSMPGLFHCFTCGACFDQKSELKTHLMEHPPVSLMKVKEGKVETFMCSGCSKTFPRKKLFLQHRKVCDQKNAAPLLNHHCLYCDKSFLSLVTRNKHHFKSHHPKRKHQPCFICKSEKCKDTSSLFKHMCLQHKDKYFGCIQCKIRFLTRTELLAHNKETLVHGPKPLEKKVAKSNDEDKNIVGEENGKEQKGKVTGSIKEFDNKHRCRECNKPFSSELNVSRHFRLAHGVHPRRKVQPQVVTVKEEKEEKIDVKETKEASEKTKTEQTSKPPLSPPPPPVPPPPPPPVMDPETLFYSRIAINIRENLLHHLDGKLDSQEVLEYDLNSSADQASKNKLMNFSASFTSSRGSSETESSISDSRHSSNPVSPKVPWEKFNFPKNYDGRCGLTSYIKDMSHLDISTQLTMRRNLQRLNSTAEVDPSPDILADIPAGLSLIGSSCAESFGETEEDSASKEENKGTELSGEWTRPRSYVCAVCNLNTSNLWELEDHKLALHPNVWCPHHEVLAEHTSCWEWVYARAVLAPSGILGPPSPTEVPAANVNSRCTKCNKHYPSSSDLHRHMLDCGGDTTWMSTMLAVSSPGGTRRNRKWRPFGSRRRRQQGRRGLKRNIPNTPAKQPGMRIRSKPGDTESIQKMIANLPPKRITRRIIGEDGEIKTRSQGTISSASVGVSVMQKSRSSLAKFVKKPDGSRSVSKHVGTPVGKGMKEPKANVEEKKDDIKLLKKQNKPVKKLFAENNFKNKVEVSNDSKTENVECKLKKEKIDTPVKKEKLDDRIVGVDIVSESRQLAEGNKKAVKSEVQSKAEVKEINIVVVSSGKRPDPSDSGVKSNDVQVTKKKKVSETDRENIICVEECGSKVNRQEKFVKAEPQTKLKEDKGINTEPEICEVVTTVAVEEARLESTQKEIAVENKTDSKLVVSPKKNLKGKKDENEKKKSLECVDKKKKENEELKSKGCSEESLIICNGCGTQFDSASACQRHMKKCVYWKEEKVLDEGGLVGQHTCGICNQTFPFLMALLRHKCDSPTEDRAMPELIREEPFDVAPVEITNDIPVLSPEDIQKSITEKAAGKKETQVVSQSPSNQKVIEKKKIVKPVYKRTSTVESIADTIREVSQETFSIDKFTWNNGSISHKKDLVISDEKPVVADIVSPSSIPSDIPGNSNPSVISAAKLPTKEVIVVNSMLKTVPKLVKIPSQIVDVEPVNQEEENTNQGKFNSLPVVHHKAPRGIKRNLKSIRQKRRNTKRIGRKKLNRPIIKKKRSTALEILLRENKLMAESRKPVKTIEKRRSNSPIRSISKRYGKRRKLNHDESYSKNYNSHEDSKDQVEMDVISENSEDISSEGDDIGTGNKVSLVKSDIKKEIMNSEENEQSNDIQENKKNEDHPSEQLKDFPKNQSRNPAKKSKLVSNESLIITGSRRKTGAVNRWDMYKPSCSNGKVYCEPCNKEVREDGMFKHELSQFHMKNIDLKNDFDNLFPDEYKFVTRCNECSWNFATPFTCYKHYLQKHEDSLLEILEQAMVEKKEVRSVLEETLEKSEDAKQESNRKHAIKTEILDYMNPNIKQELSDGEIENFKPEKMTEELENSKKKISSDGKIWVREELQMINDPQNKLLSGCTNLIYCDACNKGVKTEKFPKHQESSSHRKCINLKNEFDDKFTKEAHKLFPVYCEKCNWHFTSPFLCYKHYLWKHPNEYKQIFDSLGSKTDVKNLQNFDKCIASGKENSKNSESESPSELVSDGDKCERLVVPADEVDSCIDNPPSHLFCKICCKKVKFDLVYKHINTSLHKQNLESSTESVTLPTECKWCQWVVDSPFLCSEHNEDNFESQCVGSMKKKRKKKKAVVKRDEESENSLDIPDKHLKIVRRGRIVKKRKKLKVKKISEKLHTAAKDNLVMKPSEKSRIIEKAIEIRTDIVANVSTDRLMKRKKKRYKFSQIRNSWKVSVIDPGLVTGSDSSCNDIKVAVKTEKPELIQSSLPETSKVEMSKPPPPSSTDIKTTVASTSAAAATERRSSSIGGSEFYCLLCQKQFSSAILLVRHQNSSMHKYKESRSKPPVRNTKSRANDSSPGFVQTKPCDLQVVNIKQEQSNCNNYKLRECATPPTIPVESLTQIVSQFPGSEGSETSQEWIDSNRFVNLQQRDNVEQASFIQNQDWTHEWVMNGSDSGLPQWETNNSNISSHLWDNSENFINPAGCSSSLGSILDSVNKILANDGDVSVLPQYSLAELQSAMGASDEEMAMLQQLGERSLQDDFMYDGSGSMCLHQDQWSVSGSASGPGSNVDDNTTTLMDLDNQQPALLPPPPPSSLVPLHQSVVPNVDATSTSTGTSVMTSSNNPPQCSTSMKPETVGYCENVDKVSCRGLWGGPKRLLGDYESREMVCPSCCKHFLGLSALQSHLAWSKCSHHSGNNQNTRSSWLLKRKAMLKRPDEVDRRLVCFICKEIFNCPTTLNRHVTSNHLKKPETQVQLSPNQNSDGSDGAEKLKSKMSSALGGLLDRALNNLLCAKGPSLGLTGQEGGPELSSGTIQLLGKLCATRFKTETGGSGLQGSSQCRQDNSNKDKPSNATSTPQLQQVIPREEKHKDENSSNNNAGALRSTTIDLPVVLSDDQEKQPLTCPICDERFLLLCSRNRHIARAHMKSGVNNQKLDEKHDSTEQDNPDDSEFDEDWRDLSNTNYDSDAAEGSEKIFSNFKPICSDCGLSFSSLPDVVRHRKKFHPVKPEVLEEAALPVSENIVDSTSGEGKRRGKRPAKSVVNKKAPEQVGSSKETIRTRKRTVATKKSMKKNVSSKSEQNSESAVNDSSSESGAAKVEDKLKEEESGKNAARKKPCIRLKRRKSSSAGDDKLVGSKKKEDKRKMGLAYLAQEEVRVKAEAALRELNVSKRNKYQSSPVRWGVDTLRFTKPNPSDTAPSAAAAIARAKFTSLFESKSKIPNSSTPPNDVGMKAEPVCQSNSETEKQSDIYDFNDEELFTKKVTFPYGQQQQCDDRDRQPDNNDKLSQYKVLESPLDS